MKKYKQLVVDNTIGDCFRACMATLLQLPPQILPNDHSPAWRRIWDVYLDQFGLTLSSSNNADQPIWQSAPWIASVKSINYKGGTHAILVHQACVVLHDPSTKKRYKTGSMVDSSKVLSGCHLIVSDASRLHNLQAYRKRLGL